MKDLGDLLNGTSETEEATTVEMTAESHEEVAEVEETASQEQETDAEETSEETTTGLNAELPSAEELQKQLEASQKEANAYKVKARDEKSKRQALEERAQKPKEALPDSLSEDFSSKVDERIDSSSNEAVSTAVMRVSRASARRSDPEFDAKLERYNQLFDEGKIGVETQAAIEADDSPFHAMLDFVDRFEKLEQMNDPAFMEAHDKEVAAKAVEEYIKQQEAKTQKTQSITPNLAKQGSESVSDNNWSGPTPLNSLLAS